MVLRSNPVWRKWITVPVVTLALLGVSAPPAMAAPTSITLSAVSLNLRTGETATVTATVLPDSANQSVSWSSTNSRVATVNAGVVSAIGPGTATIKATTTEGGLTAQLSLQVTAGAPRRPLFGLPTWRNNGFIVPITNFDPAFNWLASISGTNSQSNPTVSIATGGLLTVTGMSDGSDASVLVETSRTGYESDSWTFSGSAVESGEAPLAITTSVTGVSLDLSSVTLVNGRTATVKATVLPVGASDQKLRWSSSNSRVATVSNGVITATGEGIAQIRATSRDGAKSARVDVSVSVGNALTPKFGTPTGSGREMRIPITNYDPAFTWSATATVTGTANPVVSFDTSGAVRVSPVKEGAKVQVSLVIKRSGYNEGSGTYSGMYLDTSVSHLLVGAGKGKRNIVISFPKAFSGQTFRIERRSGPDAEFQPVTTGKLDRSGQVHRQVTVAAGNILRLVIGKLRLAQVTVR